MPTNYNKNSFSSTYNDDWAKERAYHKVLFHGGRALQARELNQMQSIIQAEIARLGSNLFKDGAMVNPGGASVNTAYEYVRLNPAGGQPTVSHIGKTLTGSTSGVKATVVQYVAPLPGGNDPATFYVQYNDDGDQTETYQPIRFTPGEVLTSSGGAGSVTVESSGTDPRIYPVGPGCSLTTTEGDFFVAGHFVNVPGQQLILSKYSPLFSGEVGFRLVQDIVTTTDTNTLFDNQGGSPNLSSPGADRYRIRLILTKKEHVASTQTYIQLCSIQNGVITKIGRGTDYNKINDLLAKRTHEESGDYTVKPFKINFEYLDSAITDAFNLNISPGTAYVRGYRAESPGNVKLWIPKPTTTETVTDEYVPLSYRQYVTVDGTNASGNRGLPSLYSTVNLYAGAGGTSTVIGTAAVRQIEADGDNYRLHLINLEGSSLTSGNGFRDVLSIGTGTTDYFNVVQINSESKIIGDNDRHFVFPLPRTRPSTFGTGNAGNTDVVFTTQRLFGPSTANGSGQITVSVSATGESLTDTTGWIVSSGDSAARTYSASGTSTSQTISGLVAGTAYEVLAYVQKANGVHKDKTLTASTSTGTITADSDHYLGQPDVFDITAIKDSANGVDISNNFVLNRQIFDAYYGESRLDNLTGYAGPVHAAFRYFARGGSGDFYSVNSYSGVDYGKIPVHKFQNIPEMSARDFIDFRPDYVSSSYSNKFDPPKNGTNILSPVSYYLPRADKLVLGTDGILKYIRGVPAQEPTFKKTPDDTLELYKIIMNGNTVNNKDVKITPIEHKRYTMKDINTIEKKLDRLEEVVSLSLLEVETKNLNILDSSGNVRTKSGFFVDNFSDHSLSDTRSPEYRAAIDPISKLIRPSYNRENIRLIKNTSESRGIKFIGDVAMLDYNEILWNEGSNPEASQSENVNPFLVNNFAGQLTLSPASDDWKVTEYEPDKVIDGGQRLDRVEATCWNEEEWGWAGTPVDEYDVGAELSRVTTGTTVGDANIISQTNYAPATQVFGDAFMGSNVHTITATTTTTSQTVQRVVSNETIKEVVGERVVQTAFVPFMRSRKVYFKAEGLRPNTQMYAYFDEKSVANWVRTESSFVTYASTTDDTNDTQNHANLTQHPDGKTTLFTDSKGALIGSFFIPSQRVSTIAGTPYKEASTPDYLGGNAFRAGNRLFKLLDSPVNNNKNTLASAQAVYSASGTIETIQREILSTRLVEYVEYSESIENTNYNTQWHYGGVFVDNTYVEPEMEISSVIDEVDPNGDLIVLVENGVAGNYVNHSSSLGSLVTVSEIDVHEVTATSTTSVEDVVQPAILSDGYLDANGADGVDPIANGSSYTTTVSSTDASIGSNTAVLLPDGTSWTAGGTNNTTDDGLATPTSYQSADPSTATLVAASASSADANQNYAAYYSGFDLLPPQKVVTNDLVRGNLEYVDPVAQTFLVTQPEGMFLTKAELFFETVDADIPVRIEIRPTVNGVPDSRRIVPGSRVTVAGADAVGITSQVANPTMADVLARPTTFSFTEPVYLRGNTEYAICVIAPNTLKYKVYVSEMEKFVLGSNEKRSMNSQLGSFFKSQNSTLWEPSQRLDLCYRFYRANFIRDGELRLENAAVQRKLLSHNPIEFTSGDSDVRISHSYHGFIAGDTVNLSGLDSSTSYGGITGANIMGDRTIVKVDHTGYTFKAATAATTTTISGGEEVTATRNMQFTQCTPIVDNIVPETTSLTVDGRFTTGRSMAGTETRFTKGSFGRTPIKIAKTFENPHMIANAGLETSQLSGAKSVDFNVGLKTRSTFVSPVVDLQRTSLTLAQNKIDNQVASTPSAVQNVPINYVAESDPKKGSAAAKHITKPVTLVEDATGIKTLLTANVPLNSNFEIWFRTTLANGTPIEDVSWTLQEPENTLPKDANPDVFREYEYVMGGAGGTLSPFNQFQLKIVMKSSNNCRVPKIRDLRAIALVD